MGGLSSVWNDFIRFHLTLNVPDPKVYTTFQDILFTTGELKANPPLNVLNPKSPQAQNISFSTVGAKVINSSSTNSDPKFYDKNINTSDLILSTSSNIMLGSKVHSQVQYNKLGKPKDVSQYVLIQSVNSQEDNSSKSWKYLIMDGPCSYSKMGNLYDSVIFKYRMNTQKLIKKLNHEDWELKLEHDRNIGATQYCVKTNIHGQCKLLNNYNPYFKVGEENYFGVKSVFNHHLSNDSGLSLNVNQLNKAISSLYTSFQYKNPAVVLDIKFQFSKHYQFNNMELLTEFSGVFGYKFDSFGILAGFSLVKNYSNDSKMKNICQAISLGLVLQSSLLRFTLQPNNDLLTTCWYFKINNKLEIATYLKGNWRTQKVLNKDHEVGFKWKHSNDFIYGLKFNMTGDITVGTWYQMESLKMGLFTYFKFQNQFEEIGRNIGFFVEF